jgi:hypothetical protein
MTHYTEFEISSGRSTRHGICDVDHIPQPAPGSAIALIASRPGRQRIKYDFLDAGSRAINPRAVNLTPEEVMTHRPPEIAEEDRPARITQADWRALLARVEALEGKWNP